MLQKVLQARGSRQGSQVIKVDLEIELPGLCSVEQGQMQAFVLEFAHTEPIPEVLAVEKRRVLPTLGSRSGLGSG